MRPTKQNKSTFKPRLALLFIGTLVLMWMALLFSIIQDFGEYAGTVPTDGVDAAGDKSLRIAGSASVGTPKRQIVQPQPQPQPPSLAEVERNMTTYLQTLHQRFLDIAGPRVNGKLAWETFLEVTRDMPMTWDFENKYRQYVPREDGSIYVALGTYRDPFCPMTIKSLYSQAKHPEKLHVGLFQQNCFEKVCRTGVLAGGKVENAGPDVDCYIDFCKSPEGIQSNACNTGQVRLFNVNESESLGPYMARYLGSKFYMGEQYYLQIDSHSQFTENWDTKLIKMVEDAPARKPVISTYPPDSQMKWKDTVGWRMCDSTFATSSIEHHIVRLSPSGPHEYSIPKVPKYAPFVAAGFFFGPASLLQDVPFDPFLPWIFMGEEISMSARLWTAGYDIFSPTMNVLNHYYVRRHYPKFWESVNRGFKRPIHNDIVEIVLKRVKNMLGYSDCKTEDVHPQSVLYRHTDWAMGTERPLSEYMAMVGLNPATLDVHTNGWCKRGETPPQALPYVFNKAPK